MVCNSTENQMTVLTVFSYPINNYKETGSIDRLLMLEPWIQYPSQFPGLSPADTISLYCTITCNRWDLEI